MQYQCQKKMLTEIKDLRGPRSFGVTISDMIRDRHLAARCRVQAPTSDRIDGALAAQLTDPGLRG